MTAYIETSVRVWPTDRQLMQQDPQKRLGDTLKKPAS